MIINKPWNWDDETFLTISGKKYDVHKSAMLAADLPVKELLVEDMNIGYGCMCKSTFRSFLEHMKAVNEADLDFPILLNQDGEIIDGRHRLAKAIIYGHKTIKAKRFIADPKAIYEMVDD